MTRIREEEEVVRVSASYKIENHQESDLERGLDYKNISSASSIFANVGRVTTVSHHNAHPQSLGPTEKLFF